MQGKTVIIPFPYGNLNDEFIPWLYRHIGVRGFDWYIEPVKPDPEGPYHMAVTIRRGKTKLAEHVKLRWI